MKQEVRPRPDPPLPKVRARQLSRSAAAPRSWSRRCRSAKVENQQYIHYRKGSLVMYALKDYIGEDTVNAALKKFLTATRRFKRPPYTTSHDFMDDAARGRVDPTVEAADGRPVLRRSPCSTTAWPRPRRPSPRRPLRRAPERARGESVRRRHRQGDARARQHAHRHRRIRPRRRRQGVDRKRRCTCASTALPDGDCSLTVTVDGEPYQAGIDPYNKLIDRVPDDNRMKVLIGN